MRKHARPVHRHTSNTGSGKMSLSDDHQDTKNHPLFTSSAHLSERLHTEHIKVSEDDSTCDAAITRGVGTFVADLITPRQMLGLLRVLKATTFCFLILTLIADAMYIIFLEVLADKEIRVLAGGVRDVIIRAYALLMSIIAIGIEVDYPRILRKFSALKGFVSRSMLLFFIAVVTGSHPVHARYNDGESEIPTSALGFQMVTSFTL
jgi:hypothetical protein